MGFSLEVYGVWSESAWRSMGPWALRSKFALRAQEMAKPECDWLTRQGDRVLIGHRSEADWLTKTGKVVVDWTSGSDAEG